MKKNAYYDIGMECMSESEKKSFQISLLDKTFQNALKNSKFYQGKYKNVSFTKIKNFSDFSTLPLTTKSELLNAHKYSNLCIPLEDIVEVHFSSATTNKPTPSFFSHKDLVESSKCLATTWYMQGVRKESVFAMLASYGLFSAGLLNHYAIQEIGSFILPISAITTIRALEIIQSFNADSMTAVASYYLYIIEEMQRLGIKDFPVQTAIAGGEPFSETQREYIESKLGLQLYDQYGLCEINTGIAGECKYKRGLHVLDFYVYPEIVNPNTGEILGDGKEGELVLTTLRKEAYPLLRYRTGDICSINHAKCMCGRTTSRISRIKKRLKETYYFRGIKIDTEEIRNFLETQEHIINPYIWTLEFVGDIKEQKIFLNVIPLEKDKNLLFSIAQYFKNRYNIKIEMKSLTDEQIFSLTQSKIKHFVDKRQNIYGNTKN